jgi:hypothetical protein
MLDTKNLWAPFLISALVAGSCWAQAEKSKDEPQKFYRLDFTVKEVGDGKVINSRSYSTMISTGAHPGSIRTGNKVPFQTGPASNYDYLDVGVKVDCRLAREVDNQLWLWVTADVSNLAPGSAALSAGVPPLLRQNSWSSDLILPLRKPTVIFSSDDPTSTHKMQVELTATPIR